MKLNFTKVKIKNRKYIWVLGVVIVLAFFGIYLYSDICHTSIKGVVFWETLFSGKWNEFYSYYYPGVENSYFPDGSVGAAYDYLFYLFFAIWDFPLWCFEKLTDLSFLSTYFTRVYAKAIVLFFTIISGILVKKIIESIDETQGENGLFYFFFSPLLLMVVVLMGGYDIISVFFSLLGIWFYLDDKKVSFIFSFAIAVVCKMFALFIFVPLVLLKQKKIIKALIEILSGTSLIIVSKLITSLGGLINFLETDMIAHANLVDSKMFSSDMAIIKVGNIPLFFAATFLLWWICWKKNKVTKIETIYVALLSMSIFVAFVDVYPYWIVLLAPYVAIIMAINTSNRLNNFILEMTFSIGYIVYQIGVCSWCFSLQLLNKMFGAPDKEYLYYNVCGINSLIKRLTDYSGVSMKNIYSIFACCFIVGLGLFLYENRPKMLQMPINEKQNDHVCMDLIRIFVCIGVMLIPMSEILRYYVI